MVAPGEPTQSDVTCTPGAEIATHRPVLLKEAKVEVASMAATVMAPRAPAGEVSQAARCTATQVVYGVVMLVGASSVGLFAAVNALLVSLAMPPQRANDEVEGLLKGW